MRHVWKYFSELFGELLTPNDESYFSSEVSHFSSFDDSTLKNLGHVSFRIKSEILLSKNQKKKIGNKNLKIQRVKIFQNEI